MFFLISGVFIDDKVTLQIEDYLEQKMKYLESKIFNLILEILLCFEKNDTILHALSEEVLKFAILEVCICSFLADYKSIYDSESSPAVTDIFL